MMKCAPCSGPRVLGRDPGVALGGLGAAGHLGRTAVGLVGDQALAVEAGRHRLINQVWGAE